jgi:glycine/D-amino acid oxidase-like deaminating enzyme
VKVIVIGGGIMGLCAAWALRRAGVEVILHEQGPIPNPLASSADQHRLIRYAYGPLAGYGRMVADAYGAWDRLWQDLGARHYHATGMLAVARSTGGWVEDSLAGMTAMGLPVERLAPAAIARHFPFLDLASARFALYSPTGGVLLAERILADLAGHLRQRGAALHEHSPVAALDPARAEVTLADGRRRGADALVVAAGPWAPRLVPALQGRVVPSRQIAVYLAPPAEHLAAWERAPMLLDQVEAAKGGFYAVPPVGGTGLKVGDHGFSLQGQPDQERDATDADIARALEAARARLAGFERYRVVGARTCFYSVAPEERFILEPLERAWVLAGFSGHGFKFGALLGEAAADAVLGRRPAADLAAWAAGRL